MPCPPPVPVSIPLIFTALAMGLSVFATWLGSILKSRTRVDLKAVRELGKASARRRMATPISNAMLLSDTLKEMGYAVRHDARRLRLAAHKGGRYIEFQGQVDGTWEAQAVPAVSDAAFRALVRVIVATYAKKSQTPAAGRFTRGAPAFGPSLSTAVKTEVTAEPAAAASSPQWTPPQRQAVKVGAR